MKNLFLILISVVMFSVGSGQTTKIYYTWVMHPEMRMDKAGNCPRCGMTLIKKTVKAGGTKPAGKKEEDKPEPKQTQPAKQDEHNGMDIDMPMQAKTQAEQSKTKVVYTYVMHSEVQMDKPGN